MGGAIGQMLSSAVGVAISPLPLVVVVLMLATPRARANGIAFAAGWMVTLAAVGVVVLVIGGSTDADGAGSTWTYWLKLTIGGAAAISSAPGGVGAKAAALVLFVLIASLCVLIPLTVYLIGGKKAATTLEGWKVWMAAHNAAIMVTLLTVLAAKYIGDAITGLT